MDWAKQVVVFFVAIVFFVGCGLWIAGYRPSAGRNEIAIEIDKPASQVFPWLVEAGKLNQWIAGMSGKPVRTGFLSGDVTTIRLDSTELTVAVTAATPNELVAAHIESPGLADDVQCRLTELDGKTRLDCSGVARYKTGLARLMEPVVTPAAQKELEKDVAKLKMLVESY